MRHMVGSTRRFSSTSPHCVCILAHFCLVMYGSAWGHGLRYISLVPIYLPFTMSCLARWCSVMLMLVMTYSHRNWWVSLFPFVLICFNLCFWKSAFFSRLGMISSNNEKDIGQFLSLGIARTRLVVVLQSYRKLSFRALATDLCRFTLHLASFICPFLENKCCSS